MAKLWVWRVEGQDPSLGYVWVEMSKRHHVEGQVGVRISESGVQESGLARDAISVNDDSQSLPAERAQGGGECTRERDWNPARRPGPPTVDQEEPATASKVDREPR